MILLDQIRADELIQFARQRFDPNLSQAELKVLRDSAGSEDLPDPEEDAPRPVVRAEFLRWLAADPEAAPHIDPQGLRVYGATITGKLDLGDCHVRSTLDFRSCTFQGEMILRFAETRGILIFNSSLAQGIRADGVAIHGAFFLRRTESEGEIRLLSAEITGDFSCSGAKLKGKDDALSADGARIGGNVFLDKSFESEGEVRLLGAEIEGDLVVAEAKVRVVHCKNLGRGRSYLAQH
jgi:hypothetical protein